MADRRLEGWARPMTQMQSGGTRRKGSGSLDMYTGLGLAGTVGLIIAAAILWMAGSNLASTGNSTGEMPWTILGQ